MTHNIWMAFFVLQCIALASCGRNADSSAKASPDGSLMVFTDVNQSKADPSRYLCVIVQIEDVSGNVVHREVTPVSDVHRWSIQWTSSNEIVIESSDIGDYRIGRQADGTWLGE